MNEQEPEASQVTSGRLNVAKDGVAIIGFVTAIVGVVKLIVAGWSSILDLLPWLGLAYMVAFWAWNAVLFVRPHEDWSRRWSAPFVLGGLIAPLGFFFDRDYVDGGLAFLGALVLILGALVACSLYYDYRRETAESLHECPDCAESVKKKAKVCRYCGHRFPAKPDREEIPA